MTTHNNDTPEPVAYMYELAHSIERRGVMKEKEPTFSSEAEMCEQFLSIIPDGWMPIETAPTLTPTRMGGG